MIYKKKLIKNNYIFKRVTWKSYTTLCISSSCEYGNNFSYEKEGCVVCREIRNKYTRNENLKITEGNEVSYTALLYVMIKNKRRI